VIGPTTGSYAGQRQQRKYELRIHTTHRPAAVSVDGKRSQRWRWVAHDSTAYLTLPVESIRHAVTITW
jgi:hypothetical protein